MKWLGLFVLVVVLSYSTGAIVADITRSGQWPFAIESVEVTAYSPDPAQTDDTPWETASGKVVKPHELEQLRYVAVSRDLIKQYDIEWGDVIWIAFEVQDTMNMRIKNGVDIFFRSKDLALKFGRQKRTVIIERMP